MNSKKDFFSLGIRRFLTTLHVLRKQSWIHTNLICEKLSVNNFVVLKELLKVNFKLKVLLRNKDFFVFKKEVCRFNRIIN